MTNELISGRWCSVSHAAKELGLTQAQVRWHIQQGRLRTAQAGSYSKILIRAEDIERMGQFLKQLNPPLHFTPQINIPTHTPNIQC